MQFVKYRFRCRAQAAHTAQLDLQVRVASARVRPETHVPRERLCLFSARRDSSALHRAPPPYHAILAASAPRALRRSQFVRQEVFVRLSRPVQLLLPLCLAQPVCLRRPQVPLETRLVSVTIHSTHIFMLRPHCLQILPHWPVRVAGWRHCVFFVPERSAVSPWLCGARQPLAAGQFIPDGPEPVSDRVQQCQ